MGLTGYDWAEDLGVKGSMGFVGVDKGLTLRIRV